MPHASTPLVSVVIPCYNAQRYIGATIASVLAQKEVALEIIVVDDGSRDGSVALVRKGFPAVRVVEQANAGVAAARNAGIAAARGEWIAFIDADDIWLPGKLAAQLARMAALPDCRMSYTAWKVWPSDVPQPPPDYLARLQDEAMDSARWAGASGWIYPQLLLDCVVWTSTVLMRRTLLAELNGFDTTLRLGEDYDLWLRASRVTPIERVARPYALYRIHPASITKATPAENYRARVIGQALGRWGLASPDGRMGDAPAVRRMLAKSWSDFAGAHLQARNLGQARRAGWTALRTDPTHVPAWKVLVKTGLKALSPSKEKA
ncbi:glycosyltransferase [Massilia sp. DJPM01]|uniref:glycosyltransferase family 2 protein n=1 Tax=Massilia sp. DJPM01 TaxID=3024404 RepID=UPI00259F198D|nr:glycosyltransferase [Massilia sp. DJPM01]MDM5176047.1 glycosyltransferase [Massilia sp. DJPM01]